MQAWKIAAEDKYAGRMGARVNKGNWTRTAIAGARPLIANRKAAASQSLMKSWEIENICAGHYSKAGKGNLPLAPIKNRLPTWFIVKLLLRPRKRVRCEEIIAHKTSSTCASIQYKFSPKTAKPTGWMRPVCTKGARSLTSTFDDSILFWSAQYNLCESATPD